MPVVSVEHRFPVATVGISQHCSVGEMSQNSVRSGVRTEVFIPSKNTASLAESSSPSPSESRFSSASSVNVHGDRRSTPIKADSDETFAVTGGTIKKEDPLQSRSRLHTLEPIVRIQPTLSVATTATTRVAGSIPLPKEVQNILIEVARTGSCRSFAWSRQVHRSTNTFHHSQTHPSVTGLVETSNRKRPRTEHHSNNIQMELFSENDFTDTNTTPRESVSSETDTCHSSTLKRGYSFNSIESEQVSQHSLPSTFQNLQQVFYIVMVQVLDDFYMNRGGYRITSLEKRRMEQYNNIYGGTTSSTPQDSNHPLELAKRIFLQRRERLLHLLGDGVSTQVGDHRLVEETMVLNASEKSTAQPTSSHPLQNQDIHPRMMIKDGPPFTIQRIAEILLTPERYYQQTHKLCNALEKLLLVTSSTKAFGGVSGGDTCQNTREVQELVALADERGREVIEQRDRRLKRRKTSFSDEFETDTHPTRLLYKNYFLQGQTNTNHTNHSSSESAWDKETSVSAEVYSPISSHRLNLSSYSIHSPTNILNDSERNVYSNSTSHGTNSSYSPRIIGPLSTIDVMDTNTRMYNYNNTSTHNCSTVNSNLRPQSPSFMAASTPNETLHKNGSISPYNQETAIRSTAVDHTTIMTEGKQDKMEIIIAPPPIMQSSHELSDPYGDLGRFSASYSDIDSESGDDISLDDSASDKSDGSEGMMGSLSGGVCTGMVYSTTWGTTGGMNAVGGGNTSTNMTSSTSTSPGNDPSSSYSTSTARIMAWNRMHQQQRREQYNLIQNRGSLSLSPSQPYSPLGLSDSEYQSGDSIDSMMAEDSEGSESSSSDA